MRLYFIDRFAADIQLLPDGKLHITGPSAEVTKQTLEGYRRAIGNGTDAEIYAALPKIYKGYWHVGEDYPTQPGEVKAKPDG